MDGQNGQDGSAVEAPRIDAALVQRLVAAQFPQWAGLSVVPAEPQGWDNRTFHLGTDLAVRLPSAVGYAAQVDKEHRWLPVLAAWLPLPIPVPRARGRPGEGYPFAWSVYSWLDGDTALTPPPRQPHRVARSLARFLRALHRVPTAGGPVPGPHSAFRGGPLLTYDDETRRAIAQLGDLVDVPAVVAVWEAALAATWEGPAVWFHGDVAAGNLLLRGDDLAAVIDFGCCGVGDPACDVTIAWTLFSGRSRAEFRTGLPLDAATWARGRAWAAWKALITIAQYRSSAPARASAAARVLHEVVTDHRAEAA